jgi:hypothetical protein
MSIATIEAEIMNVLNGVSGLKAYDHIPARFESLPAVTLEYTGFEQARESFGTLGGNRAIHEITYAWELKLYVRIGTYEKDALSQVKSYVNQILTAFKQDLLLNGAAADSGITAGALFLDDTVENPRFIHVFNFYATEREE